MNNTTNKVYVHYSASTLRDIKEKLIAIDIINQLDIADGLKDLLFSVLSLLKDIGNSYNTIMQ